MPILFDAMSDVKTLVHSLYLQVITQFRFFAFDIYNIYYTN